MKTYLNYLPVRLAPVLCASGLFLTLAQPGAMAAEPAAPEPPKKWESVASLGATLTRGNSENFLANATINSSRKWTRDEVLLGASGGYGSTTVREEGEPDETNKTDEYLKGFAQWNHLFTQRFYCGLRFDALYDDIADIDYRFTLSPLAGYYFIKQTNTFLSGELGPSFVYEKQGGETDFYVGARVGERFEYNFKNGAKIWQTVEWIPQVDDFDNWILNFEAGIAAPINKTLDVRLVVQDSYDHEPAEGREKNDLKVIAGIGYKF